MAHYTNGDVTRPFAPAALLRSAVALLLPGGAGVALCLLGAPGLAAAQSPVGPETCKACHPSAYEAWRETPHAHAQESLPPKSRKDPRCTTCHAPDLEKGVAAVSCEACHGPGQHYAAAHVMRDAELARLVGLAEPGERTCLRCHTESAPSLARFDLRSRMKLIAHWRELPPKAP
jgi:hypothetical protein